MTVTEGSQASFTQTRVWDITYAAAQVTNWAISSCFNVVIKIKSQPAHTQCVQASTALGGWIKKTQERWKRMPYIVSLSSLYQPFTLSLYEMNK